MKLGLFQHAGDDRPLLAIVLLLVGTLTLGLQDSLMKLRRTISISRTDGCRSVHLSLIRVFRPHTW